MRVKVDSAKLTAKLNQLASGELYEIRSAVRAGAEDVLANAVTGIARGGRSGRTYKRGRKVHHASAPGEYPATDSGNLVRHISVEMESGYSATVGSRQGVPYGRVLELGGYVRGVYHHPRPWLKPSLQQSLPFIERVINGAVSRAVRRKVK